MHGLRVVKPPNRKTLHQHNPVHFYLPDAAGPSGNDFADNILIAALGYAISSQPQDAPRFSSMPALKTRVHRIIYECTSKEPRQCQSYKIDLR